MWSWVAPVADEGDWSAEFEAAEERRVLAPLEYKDRRGGVRVSKTA